MRAARRWVRQTKIMLGHCSVPCPLRHSSHFFIFLVIWNFVKESFPHVVRGPWCHTLAPFPQKPCDWEESLTFSMDLPTSKKKKVWPRHLTSNMVMVMPTVIQYNWQVTGEERRNGYTPLLLILISLSKNVLSFLTFTTDLTWGRYMTKEFVSSGNPEIIEEAPRKLLLENTVSNNLLMCLQQQNNKNWRDHFNRSNGMEPRASS